MMELRSAGTSIRVLFIFDPRRRASLLLGGDKAGNWKRWYDKNVRSPSSGTRTGQGLKWEVDDDGTQLA